MRTMTRKHRHWCQSSSRCFFSALFACKMYMHSHTSAHHSFFWLPLLLLPVYHQNHTTYYRNTYIHYMYNHNHNHKPTVTVFMEFSGQDIAKTSLCLMAGTMLGSPVSKWTCRWLNPLNSYRLGLVLVATFIALTVAILRGPEYRNAAFAFAATWGGSMGVMYPSQRVLYCTLIPKGQETEFMGLFVFAGQLLGWLPALLFTIMNENSVDIRWGMGLVSAFCIAALLCTLPMGSYHQAAALVSRDSKHKLASVIAATTNKSKCAGDHSHFDPTPTPPLSAPLSAQLSPTTRDTTTTTSATSSSTPASAPTDLA
jgi:Vacuole effluxer Atg22 like